jgi:hypothetical protein
MEIENWSRCSGRWLPAEPYGWLYGNARTMVDCAPSLWPQRGFPRNVFQLVIVRGAGNGGTKPMLTVSRIGWPLYEKKNLSTAVRIRLRSHTRWFVQTKLLMPEG